MKNPFCNTRYICLILILLLANFQLYSQDWNKLGEGAPIADIPMQDYFGKAISIDGDVAVVGAPQNSETHRYGGKAFIFQKINNVWEKMAELTPSNPFIKRFGTSVAIKGDYIFVGAPEFDEGGTGRGAVIVFKKQLDSWVEITKLVAADFTAFAHFGTSVTFDGTTVVIGAPEADGALVYTGAVYVFDLVGTSFQFRDKIFTANAHSDNTFGSSVAIDDENIYVGSRGFEVNGEYVGAAFVYDKGTLALEAQLTMSPNDLFYLGYSMTVSNGVLGISAWGQNENLTYGSVFLFIKPGSNWADANESFRFFPETGVETYGSYGTSMSIDGDYLLIGGLSGSRVDLIKKGSTWGNATRIKVFEEGLNSNASYGGAVALADNDLLIGAFSLDIPAETSGAVFAYETSDNWTTTNKLPSLLNKSVSASSDGFGYDVDINGNFAIVGAPFDDSHAISSGCAYVFEFKNKQWVRIAKLTPSDSQEEGYFGMSVAITQNRIVVSAPQAKNRIGRVYVFDKPLTGWIDATENSTIEKVDSELPGFFGYSVDINESYISASQYEDGSSESVGRIYIFKKGTSEWSLLAKLDPPQLEDARGFGANHVLGGDNLAAGAQLSGYQRGGRVFVFEKKSGVWTDSRPIAILSPSDPLVIGAFGKSVDLDGNTIIVGSAFDYYSSGLKGVAYVFEKGTSWKDANETVQLMHSLSWARTKVAIHRDYALVASTQSDGGIIAFHKTDGIWKKTWAHSYGDLEGGNGSVIAVSGDHLISGSPEANSSTGEGTGLAQFFNKQNTVSYVTSTNENGTYNADKNINVKVVFSQPILLTGTPHLNLLMYDGSVKTATFQNASGSELNFNYVVHENDSTPDLNYQDELSLQGNFSITTSTSDFPSVTTLPSVNSPYSLASMKDILIDAIIQVEVPEEEIPEEVVGVMGEHGNGIAVYPNPFDSKLIVEGQGIRNYELIDVTGRTHASSKGNSSGLTTLDLYPGIYFVRVKTEDSVEVFRVVKE